MSILIRSGSESNLISASEFEKESDLELLLAERPDLLVDDRGTDIGYVDRQVVLEAGKLDLLFVDSEGVPIAVETKLESNSEARREVVAQVIDYLSSLTSLTVDELDKQVNGKLELALRALSPASDDSDFENLWQLVGANLRDGRARLVVVVDEAPDDLQRIFRFLARKSDLDVQLLSIQRYFSPSAGEVFVPQILVSRETTDKSPKEQRPELVAVCDTYNGTAPADIRAVGQARSYRMIRPADWPRKKGLRYIFRWGRGHIAAEVGVYSQVRLAPAASFALAGILSSFDGKPLANGLSSLSWDKDAEAGNGELFVDFPAERLPGRRRPSVTIAKRLPGRH